MGRQEFEQFLSEKQAEETIDWEEQKQVWLRRLEELYDNIEDFLYDFIKTGQVSIDYKPIVLHEEYVGEYTTRMMRISLKGSMVYVTPVGTLLVGSPGRVDMKGPSGEVPIVLVDKDQTEWPSRDPKVLKRNPQDVEFVWKFRTNASVFVDIDSDAFYDALMEIV